MPRTTYTLRIERPEVIDADTLAEIEAGADPRDKTLAAKIERWLGSEISEAEGHLSDVLPDGWYAAIDSDADDD